MKEENVANEIAARENLNQKKLSSLPNELLMKIIGLLPHSDLSAMMIVDKNFNNLSSNPALWKRYHIPAMTIALIYGLDVLLKVLESPRFSKLEILDLTGTCILPSGVRKNKSSRNFRRKEFQQKYMAILRMASTLPLKRLDFSHNSLDIIGDHFYQDFLVRMVINIQHVEFNSDDDDTSDKLLDKILDRVSETSVLRSLSLQYCALDQLSVSSIVKLNCLSEVSLGGAYMREEQARALLVEMGKGSNIKKFDIDECIRDVVDEDDVLENVEPEIVAKALNNVEYLIYNKLNFEEEDEEEFEEYLDTDPDVHLARFLEEMGDKATSLKKLDMDGNNYCHVSPNVLAKAFNKLEYLELKPNPAITSHHVTAVLQMMAEQTNIVHLKLIDEKIMWLYHPDLLARAVVQVEQVDILCMMSRVHISAVLRKLDSNSRLKRLNLGNNDVSEVPEHVLENAVKVLGKNGGTLIVTMTGGKKYMED